MNFSWHFYPKSPEVPECIFRDCKRSSRSRASPDFGSPPSQKAVLLTQVKKTAAVHTVLPLLFVPSSRSGTSSSACQHSSAVKGGPIAALPYIRTVRCAAQKPCSSVFHLSLSAKALHRPLSSASFCRSLHPVFTHSGLLCKTSARLLSSSSLLPVISIYDL